MDTIVKTASNDDKALIKIGRTLQQPKVYIPIIVIVLALAVIASIVSQYRRAAITEGGNKTTKNFLGGLKSTEEKKVKSPLDGVEYPESVANRHTLGIIVENHPDSRPQFGLSEASVVYEAQAEGGITRFFAMYGPHYPEKVGPVRSVRTYYLDWCLEYDCFLAHVGGNIDALDAIPKLGIKDLDQFRYGVSKYGNTYYREARKGIATEHTMYTNPGKLFDIAKANNWSMTGGQPAVNFKSEAALNQRPASQSIAIEISSAQYNTVWTYDPTTNSYARAMAGLAHKDGKTGAQIKSKVVLVQEVAAKSILTRINEPGVQMTTVGTGKAKIFQDGKVTEGTWKKASQKERTVFLDADGKEVKYNAGQRWITVVEPGSKVTVTEASTSPSPTTTK